MEPQTVSRTFFVCSPQDICLHNRHSAAQLPIVEFFPPSRGLGGQLRWGKVGSEWIQVTCTWRQRAFVEFLDSRARSIQLTRFCLAEEGTSASCRQAASTEAPSRVYLSCIAGSSASLNCVFRIASFSSFADGQFQFQFPGSILLLLPPQWLRLRRLWGM